MLKKVVLHLFLLLSFYAKSQLADFQLQVTGTNETCQGNGTLQIATTNTTSGAVLTYLTYKLPDTNSPVATTSNLNGLTSGIYRVIVTQTLGTLSNTRQQEFTIENLTVNLTFTIVASNILNCDITGTIVINTLTGSAIGYEIIRGPQTFPLQASNTFTGLISGQYRIRVFDSCGQAFVRDYILTVAIPTLIISGIVTPNIATSCTTIDVSNGVSIASGTIITYPLSVRYTIQPPNGAAEIVSTQIINSGNATSLTLTKTIDLFLNSVFNYKLEITDGCGRIFFKNDNEIDPNPRVVLKANPNKCGEKFLEIVVSNFFPPFTIEFQQAPVGFNPANFNNQNLGPFSTTSAVYGSITSVVPFGNYKIKITDGCGRTAFTPQQDVQLEIVIPVASVANAGCGSSFGNITISVPNSRKLVSVIITAAPAAYAPALPNNISSQITTTGVIGLANFPVGFYNFILKDECDTTYNLNDVEVPVFVLQSLIVDQLPNCMPGSGAVKIISGNQLLTSISITSAPSNFNEIIPFNVNSQIIAGVLYLTDLPEGNYTFAGKDACGYNLTTTFAVVGYKNGAGTPFEAQRNCGSFNLKVTDNSNGTNQQKYWLQKLNPTNGSWQNPFSGAVYVAGTIPDATTAFEMANNVNNLNLTLTGNFRILKTFVTYNNGNATTIFKTCLEVFGEFEFFDNLKIDGVFNINCSGTSPNSDVLISVIGAPPFIYKIKSRNGDTSFTVNNGSNNTFLGLTPATYNFEVQDQCGAIKNANYAVGTLPNLVVANSPSNILLCQTGTLQNGSFNLTQQNSTILGSQNNSNYLVSFYTNSSDANNGTNAIANPNFFINTSNPQTIFARVVHKFILGCFATTSFQIMVGKTPVLNLTPKVYVCENRTVDLTANSGFDVYEWSNGASTQTITVSEPGDYSVVAKNRYLGLFCASASATIKVEKSGKAKLVEIKTEDWTDNNNSLSIIVSGLGNYEYSLDNINFQPTGVFSGIKSGIYTIYVKDKNGCETLKVDTYFLNYPKFFTPNGDGFNDKWQIDFSNLEPKLLVRLFDRFGKFIKEINAKNNSWDGTLNGEALPSDDYWFVVERQDGRIFKGHFSLKR